MNASAKRPVARVVTVTVSDTRTADTDGARAVFERELAACELVRHVIVKDEPAEIVALCRSIVGTAAVDAIVLSGGTGISPRDRTCEAVETLLDKRLDGFGEAFRRLSWDEVGPRAILSRAVAGVAGECLVFSLPGSVAGLRLGLRELVLPTIGHAMDQVRGRTAHAEHGGVAPSAARTDAAEGSVRILYFASVRELVGIESEDVPLPESVADVRAFAAWIERSRPALTGRMRGVRIARNEVFATDHEPVLPGDVLALIPPVAGG